MSDKVHSKSDYILYSLETGGYDLTSLGNAMTLIRQISDGPLVALVAAVTAEWNLWMEDRRRATQPIQDWNNATFGPILRAVPPGAFLAEHAIPDWSFTAFRETPEGAALWEASEKAVKALSLALAPREGLLAALRELVAATEPTPKNRKLLDHFAA